MLTRESLAIADPAIATPRKSGKSCHFTIKLPKIPTPNRGDRSLSLINAIAAVCPGLKYSMMRSHFQSDRITIYSCESGATSSQSVSKLKAI
jgi:hypothetical protein